MFYITDILRKDEKIVALIATIHGDCHTVKNMQLLLNHSDLWLKVQDLDFSQTVMIKSHPKGKIEQKLYDIIVENGKITGAKISSNQDVIKTVQVAEEKDESILPRFVWKILPLKTSYNTKDRKSKD